MNQPEQLDLFFSSDLMTISEAQCLYLYNAEAAFLLSMKDYMSHQDYVAEKTYNEAANRYAELLKQSGATIESIHGDLGRQLATAQARVGQVLYDERQRLAPREGP